MCGDKYLTPHAYISVINIFHHGHYMNTRKFNVSLNRQARDISKAYRLYLHSMKAGLQGISTFTVARRPFIPRLYRQPSVNPAVDSQVQTGLHGFGYTTPAPRRLTSISRTMSSLPTTQKGVLISKIGGPEVLEYKTDLPVPSPKEGEVLVKTTSLPLISSTHTSERVYMTLPNLRFWAKKAPVPLLL